LSRCNSSSPACRPRRTPDELNNRGMLLWLQIAYPVSIYHDDIQGHDTSPLDSFNRNTQNQCIKWKVLLSSGALFLSSVLPSVDSFAPFTPCQLPISQHSSIDTTFLQAFFPQPIPNHPLVTIILIPILLHISPFSSLPDYTSSNPFPFHNNPYFHLSTFPHSSLSIPTPLGLQSRFAPLSPLPNSIIRCS